MTDEERSELADYFAIELTKAPSSALLCWPNSEAAYQWHGIVDFAGQGRGLHFQSVVKPLLSRGLIHQVCEYRPDGENIPRLFMLTRLGLFVKNRLHAARDQGLKERG